MGQAESQVTTGLSHQDYFDLEQAQDQRYEYLAGEVFALVGGQRVAWPDQCQRRGLTFYQAA